MQKESGLLVRLIIESILSQFNGFEQEIKLFSKQKDVGFKLEQFQFPVICKRAALCVYGLFGLQGGPQPTLQILNNSRCRCEVGEIISEKESLQLFRACFMSGVRE